MRRTRAKLGLIFFLAVGLLCPLPLSSAWKEGQEQVRALRARVEQFYSLMQFGRWAEAEAYITEDSKENFRKRSKGPSLGFQVESVNLAADGQSATVVVQTQVLVQFSNTPVAMPQTTQWRLVNGLWYVVVPEQRAADFQSLERFVKGKGTSAPTRQAEELKFKGHSYRLGVIQPGQIKAARFPFTNVTDHVVTLSAVLTGCDCLKVKTEKKAYQPGESGELVIEFDPAGYKDNYEQTIVVKTNPGALTTHLQLRGYVVPPPREAPPAAGQPGSQ